MVHPKMLPAPAPRATLNVRWYESQGLVARVGLLPQLRKMSVLEIILLAASRCGTERNNQKVIAL